MTYTIVLTLTQVNILRYLIASNAGCPIDAYNEIDVRRLLHFRFVRYPAVGQIAITTEGIDWLLKYEQARSKPKGSYKEEIMGERQDQTPTNGNGVELRQCVNGDECANGNGGWQPIAQFWKDGSQPDGKAAACIACWNARRKNRVPAEGAYEPGTPLPEPNGNRNGKPFWFAYRIEEFLGLNGGVVAGRLRTGQFGAFPVGSRNAVDKSGFHQIINDYKQRRERQQPKSDEAQELVSPTSRLESVDDLIPFLDDSRANGHTPPDLMATLELLVEETVNYFQQRANAKEMELSEYFDRWVPENLLQALRLAEELLRIAAPVMEAPLP